jgi:tetratricopeptide (TPR) repeat protein
MAKKKAEYFEEMKNRLRQGDGESALKLLAVAMDDYPNDPFVMSYYGCLLALAGNQAAEGIRICKEAIKRLKEAVPVGSEFFHPMFYLNLGRAQLAIGDKEDAIKAFKLGLKMDPENKDLLGEIKKLGLRKPPPVPFLRRSNPINKYIGMLLRRGMKAVS